MGKATQANKRVPDRHKPKVITSIEYRDRIVADPETTARVAEVLDYIKKVDARSLVMFTKIRDLQKDIATLQDQLKSVFKLLVVANEPEHRRENAGIINSVLFQDKHNQFGSIHDHT